MIDSWWRKYIVMVNTFENNLILESNLKEKKGDQYL